MSVRGIGLGLVIPVVIGGSLIVCAALLYSSVFRYRHSYEDGESIIEADTSKDHEASISAAREDEADTLSLVSSGSISVPATFEPAKVVTDGDKGMLTERVLLPIVEYFLHEASESSVSALVVTKNQSVNREVVPYLVRVIFTDGRYISYPVDSGIPWWQPEELQ